MPFDLEELEKLKALGVRRVRYADGAEVELDPYFDPDYRKDIVVGLGLAQKVFEPEAVNPGAEMPSREQLRQQIAKEFSPDATGAPTVTP